MTATKIEFNAIGRVFPHRRSASNQGLPVLQSQVGSNHVLLIQTGIGLNRARLITQHIIKDESWDVVISTGFAGALNCSPVGSVVIGHEVLLGQSIDLLPDVDLPRVECHPDWVNAALNIQSIASYPLQRGRFVTVDRVLTRAAQKHLLGKRTGAIAVDMESRGIGQVAQEHGFPFLIIRAISDGVNEDLPVDFNLFLKPFGWLVGGKQVLCNPRCWKGFYRLYRNSKEAGIQLSHFFKKFLYTHPHGSFPGSNTKTAVLNP